MKKLFIFFLMALAGLINTQRVLAPNLVHAREQVFSKQKTVLVIIKPAPTIALPQTPTPKIPSTYTVKAGDTLTAIANKFGIPYGYLADQNNLSNPDLIFVGQILNITTMQPKSNQKQIYVVLSEQKVYALKNGETLKSFTVSTGTKQHPTVQGNYQIYIKYDLDDMAGPGYYLKDVPWVMYFYLGYGFHGTYWHNNFGIPMSHGCINLTVEDSKWLFEWAKVGDSVTIVP